MRELTPSIPKPRLGHPNPVATTEGAAKGKEAAEQNVIERTGRVTLVGGGMKGASASSVFSGMDRKDWMLYLRDHRLLIRWDI